jgi:chemotaxis protein MotB
MRRKPRPDPRISHERWLVSYADFITLLFAFFTTMYAISTVDGMKLNAVVESMQTAFATGDVPASRTGPGSGMPQRLTLPARPLSKKPGDKGGPKPGERDGLYPVVSIQEVKARLSVKLNRQIDSGQVDMEVDPRGLVVSIHEAGSFALGKADLSPLAREVLDEIADALLEVGNFVRVEGHTDNIPIHTERYESNWELSTARATNVVAHLLAHHVQPERLSAAGYGEFHPRVPNDTDENRARNRRMDIVVLNPLTSVREEPGQIQSSAGAPGGQPSR